ncbi:MAG: SdrD B-like domain-containing protein [bacterium]
MNKHINTFFLLLLLTFSFLVSAKIEAQKVGDYQIDFLGVTYNYQANTTTFSYKVTGDGNGKDLSHWVVALCPDHHVVSSNYNYEVNTDPRTGVYGIKWDVSVSINGTKTFTFALSGIYPVVNVQAAVKAGTTNYYGNIPGPDCDVQTPAALGNKVFLDLDQDGIQDTNEPGVADVNVKLYNSSNVFIAEMQTSNTGIYSFLNLTPGDYYVKFGLPAGYAFTLKDQGSNNELDSDVDPTTGKTVVTTLSNGETDNSWDAGIYILTAKIGNFVWNDENQDGIQDSNETGIAGVTVSLYNCNNSFVSSVVTDNFGVYYFENITPGDYYVKVNLLDSYVFSPKNQGANSEKDSDIDIVTGKTVCTTLSANETDLSWDAGLYIPTPQIASIGDYVWNDTNKDGIQNQNELGINNVTVKLYTCSNVFVSSTATNNLGKYLFENIPVGDYYIKFILPENFMFSPKDAGLNDLSDSDADLTTGKTGCYTLVAGQTNLSVDAGLYEIPQIQQADLSLVKTVNKNNPEPGETITYGLTLSNAGTSAATNVTVSDVLPNSIEFLSATASQGSYDFNTGIWTVGTVNANQSADLSISVKVKTSVAGNSIVNFGAATGFNVFVLGNMSQPSSDTEGKLAVGGDAYFSNYSVGYPLPNSNGAEDVLVVGGNLTFISGGVYGGNAVYGNNTNLPQMVVSITDGVLRKDSPIDFNAAKIQLQELSAQLSTNAQNGTDSLQYGCIYLTGNNPFINVFEISGEVLSGANDMRINVPNSSVVLVNINGESIEWKGGLVLSGTTTTNVLYNFYQATNLFIHNIDIQGTVFAPFADVNYPSGVINGQFIANSMVGAGQFNNSLFVGNIPGEVNIVNSAEIKSSDQLDPDSTPNNGDITEDDFSKVVAIVNYATDPNNGSVPPSGATWQQVTSFASNEIIWTLTFDMQGNLLAGTWGGKIYRSNDGGTNWTRINENMNVAYIWGLEVDSLNNLYAATNSGLYKSTNGTDWTIIGLDGSDVRAFAIDKNKNLYAGTWGLGIFKSTDNGTSWVESNTGLNSLAVHALTVNSANDIFVGTFGGGISKTHDGAANWIPITGTYSYIWALGVNSNDMLFAGSYSNGLYTSSDNGVTWNHENGISSNYIYAVSVDTSDNVFISAWDGGVYYYSDVVTESTWKNFGMNGFGVSSIVISPDTRSLYAGTSDGRVYIMDNPLTEVKDINVIPTEFSLSQNYPNPFNPTTNIKVSIAKAGYYELRVYNILGQLINVPLRGEYNPGNYQVTFNAVNYASGVYIYQLTGNNINLTKKMMLLK